MAGWLYGLIMDGIVAGVGVPQISAISNVAEALQGTGVPCIADGGIRFSGRYFQGHRGRSLILS